VDRFLRLGLCLQMSIIQLYLKRKHRWTDASFNEQCALNHSSRGPDNLYPRSLWLMKKIASVPEARKIQVSLLCCIVGLASSSAKVASCKALSIMQPSLLQRHVHPVSTGAFGVVE
jgi:hypothetical protein